MRISLVRALIASLCGAALALSMAAGPRALAAPTAAVFFVNDTVSDGLVAHWKFDEVGASTARDFVGTKAATLQNGASMQASPRPTVTFPNGGALTLDGVDDRVEISDTAPLNLATNFSLLGWLRRASTGNYDAIYDSGDQSNPWWVFIADFSVGKVNKFGFGVRGVMEAYSTQAITDTNWHHFAVVKNGDSGANLSFFVDGQARGTASVGTLNTPTGTKYIGALFDGSYLAPFGGSLDDIRLYNRALSPAEVLRLAQGHGCVFDGSSWPAAMRELQCALSEASPGDDIWLANGIYRAGTNREMSFILRDGVNILGGFTANPGSPSQRAAFNPFTPSTLLLGDLNGDDIAGSFATYGDNTRQVLVAPPGAKVLLDRFGVRGGNADGHYTETVGYGGGLFVGIGADVRLNQMAFLSNLTSHDGGGVFSQSPIAISATTFISNNAPFGGGLAVTATLRLTDSDFLSNTVTAFGGGIYMLTGTVTGGTFHGNRTAGGGEGGALYAEGPLEIRGPVTFTQNFAGFGGGAIEAHVRLSVTVGTFVSNSVGTFTGGAIETVGELFVDSSHFRGNRATQNGGALQLGGSATVANSDFRDNRVAGGNCSPGCSVGDGGAIFSYAPLIVTSSTFVSNTARLRGGAIAANGPLVVTLSELEGNAAGTPNDTPNPGRGGAIFAAKALTLSMSTVATNSATVVGGGLSVSGTVLVVNSNFLSNTAQSGGGIQFDGGTAKVAGSLFAGNVVTGSGAALGSVGTNAVVVNDTFAGRAANAHEAISAFDSNLVLNNTLFANYAGSVLVNMSSLLTYTFDLFFNTPLPNAGTNGGNNLSADPLFVNAAGGNFRLLQASPAIDAGLDAVVPPFLTADLDGARRVADLPGVGVVVNGVPQHVDIGAYEYQPPTVFLPIVVR